MYSWILNYNLMTSAKTSFAGLSLRCPIIVGSSSQTASVANIVEFDKAGAGAVVLKSLFEESIIREASQAGDLTEHPEAYDYVFNSIDSKLTEDYCETIREAKSQCSIPIIASIACHTDGKWIEYSKMIEEAGADALELNVMSLCTSKEYKDGDFERLHESIVKQVCRATGIPVIVKLGSNLSNPVNLAYRLYAFGAKGVVLFNRFYPTDIDVEKLQFTLSNPFTNEADLSMPIRWAGIISAAVPRLPVAVSGGIQDWKGIAKAILSGASAVEVASAIIKNGAQWIGNAVAELEKWQSCKGFKDIASYLGKLNASDPEHADRLLRTQFMKYFRNIH